jgi:hypothetical protein
MDAVERVERFVDGRLGILDIWKNDLDFSEDLRTLLSLARSNGWQDIATAPKDGSFVWLGRRGQAVFGLWDDGQWCSLGPKPLSWEPTCYVPLPDPPSPLDRLRGSEDV